ncbi:MAG: ChaN family lipoprotein [Prevotella sp.]|nr:ChaN family lipoprotein [Prevotella sp.]
MKKKLNVIIASLILGLSTLWGQETPEAYRLYDAKGNAVSYQKMIQDLALQDVVFVGEMHNCVITHWLELRILLSLYQLHGNQMVIGMEMLEADNQLIIDEYLRDLITTERFETETRLWSNYSTDYEPIVSFAYDHHLPLIATNVPRRYANAVKNHGLEWLDSLSEEAKRYLPPLPIPYKENEQAQEAFGLMAMMGKNKNVNPAWMGQSQALKDATMAWNIARHQKGKFIHFNGNYHTDSGDGIIPYLRQYRPGVTLKTVYAVRQEDITTLEKDYLGRADYYICVPEDMTTSY